MRRQFELDHAWQAPLRVVRPAVMAPTIGRTDVARFIILSQPRTGSTLLQTELNRRSPHIAIEGEVFSPKNRPPHASARDVAAAVFRWRDGATAIGCRVFYDHITGRELSDLLRIDGMKVVQLHRRNWLRAFVSQEIADRHDWWMQSHDDIAPDLEERVVHVDVRRMLSHFRYIEAVQTRTARRLRAVDVLDVWYEDLVEDLDASLQEVAAFLGVGDLATFEAPMLQRQNPEPLRLLIENLGEVEAALAGTPWAWFLDEASPPS